MFKEITLSEKETTDEAEYFGNVEAGSVIKFSRLVDWMEKVNASENSKYLKCLNWRTTRVEINNIVDIVVSESILYKDTTYDQGVKIVFQAEADVPAMSIGDAAKKFIALKEKLESLGKDIKDIEVFAQDGKSGKLSRFCWYYDDASDTAVIVKNMAPGAARKFMRAGAEAVCNNAAKSPKNTEKILDDIKKLDDQIKALKARQDAKLKQIEDMPAAK